MALNKTIYSALLKVQSSTAQWDRTIVTLTTLTMMSITFTTGAIVIYGTLAMALWLSAVIVNLHLHTVWNSKFLVNKYIMLNIICWGGPLIVTAVTLALHQVKFEFANLCLVSADWIHRLFFDPLAVIVIPSCVLHLATFFHIARVSTKHIEAKHADCSKLHWIRFP